MSLALPAALLQVDMGKGCKVVVCGQAAVGKTAILEQLLYGNHTVGTISVIDSLGLTIALSAVLAVAQCFCLYVGFSFFFLTSNSHHYPYPISCLHSFHPFCLPSALFLSSLSFVLSAPLPLILIFASPFFPFHSYLIYSSLLNVLVSCFLPSF